MALRDLPKNLVSQSTQENPTFGGNFSADVINKDGQLILLCREKLSQFTTTCIIKDETADSLRDGLVTAVIETMLINGTVIQVDCAPAFQTLAAEAQVEGSTLKNWVSSLN